MEYRRVAQLRTAAQLRQHLDTLGVMLPVDEQLESGAASLLAQPIDRHGLRIGNRFCILPMEGWDGTEDGRPSDLTRRRWGRFGTSGAKLIWGGEAVAVVPEGRANPNQLFMAESTLAEIADLRALLVREHAAHVGATDDLLIGLQLTHSGRFSRPTRAGLQPRIAYRHPLLDAKFGISSDSVVLTDEEFDQLLEHFARAAALAQAAGFAFVDIKHCHGYLLHEVLSAHERPGRYGGSFENRTRFLREVVARIRAAAPGLGMGVRLSAFDWIPFQSGASGVGAPVAYDGAYRHTFGGTDDGTGIDLTEPKRFLDLLAELDIPLVCITAGSPYYVPHIQRPALFPPSDGYLPPEDPLVGVTRQIAVTAQLKQHRPELIFVGSGYSYLQEWLPNVGQAAVRMGMVDSVGLGRMALSYPSLPADVLAGRALQRKLICRTFSECTTAPRHGMISGCFPLDDFYAARPEAAEVEAVKARIKAARTS
ncbi:MAG: NADH:flavin oxidoreductase [Chloroflexota bacterium]|nr:NADH:flavin oxidoreductase [Chloroflexota bacterium]